MIPNEFAGEMRQSQVNFPLVSSRVLCRMASSTVLLGDGRCLEMEVRHALQREGEREMRVMRSGIIA